MSAFAGPLLRRVFSCWRAIARRVAPHGTCEAIPAHAQRTVVLSSRLTRAHWSHSPSMIGMTMTDRCPLVNSIGEVSLWM